MKRKHENAVTQELEENLCRIFFQCTWEEKLEYMFNVLLIDNVFKDSKMSLITGGADGIVRIHSSCSDNESDLKFVKTFLKYETKSTSIMSMVVHETTMLNAKDILVGDGKGMLTIFMNRQILNRRLFANQQISAIFVDTDAAGNMCINIGSRDGVLAAVTPYEILWKCRLTECLKKDDQTMDDVIEVTALHTLRVHSSSIDCNYLLVADTAKCLHVFQNGSHVMTIQVPSVVTSMCTGHFIGVKNDNSNNDSNRTPTKTSRFIAEEQIALATKTGSVLVLSNFSVTPYANLPYPITQIRTFPFSNSDSLDGIFCSGHFNHLAILKNKELIGRLPTEDWVHTFDILPGDEVSHSFYVVLGCLDKRVKVVRVEAV